MVHAVRARQAEDLVPCVRLLENVHVTNDYPVLWPDDPARWLSPRGTLFAWVAEADRDVVGHVVLHAVVTDHAEWEAATALRAAELGVIGRLFVDADRHGAGIGRTLLATASTEAVARGLCPVLDVVETRPNAIQFYERRGFRRVLTKPWSADARLSHHFYVGRTCNPSKERP